MQFHSAVEVMRRMHFRDKRFSENEDSLRMKCINIIDHISKMSSENADFLNKNPNALVLRKGLGMTLPESASLVLIKLRAKISQNFLFNPT